MCNGAGIMNNFTTPAPVPMTTTNMTMHCWYGFDRPNSTNEKEWVKEVCAPQEDRCILVVGDDGFAYGHCYDVNYDDGKYSSGTFDTGEHCFRGSCHNGT